MPKVSVIVTTFNRENYLKETIQSILCQTYQDFELVVVDNFSDYDFFGFINSFNSPKIIAYQNSNNGIIAINRNLGISKAIGEYLAFCDDDDIWIANKLECQVSFLMQNPEFDIVSSKIELFSNDQLVDTNRIPKVRRKLTTFKLLYRNTVYYSTVVLRAKCLNYKFSEDPLLIATEDYQLWLKLRLSGTLIHQMNKYLVKYRISNTSAYLNQQAEMYSKLNYTIWKSLLEIKERRFKILMQVFLVSCINFLKICKNKLYKK